MSDDVIRVRGKAAPATAKSSLANQAGANVNAADYGDYTADEAITEDTLASLAALAQEQMNAEREVERRTEALATANKDLKAISEKRLPDLMEKHGLTKFEFRDAVTGQTMLIKYDSKWRVSMPGDKPEHVATRAAIYEWLGKEDVGLGGIIKRNGVIAMGTRPREQIDALLAEFKAAHPDMDVAFEQWVEAATLTSVISKRKDAGKDVHPGIRVDLARQSKATLKK